MNLDRKVLAPRRPMMYLSAVAIVVYICLNTLHEIVQLYQQRWHYLLDPINLVSWLLYVCASIMVVPIFIGTVSLLRTTKLNFL